LCCAAIVSLANTIKKIGNRVLKSFDRAVVGGCTIKKMKDPRRHSDALDENTQGVLEWVDIEVSCWMKTHKASRSGVIVK
jgi:hypothetical protein